MKDVWTRLKVLASRLRAVLASRRLDEEFLREVELHFELLTEEYVRRGSTPAEAKRMARSRLGSLNELRESHREERGFPKLESWFRDLGFGLRMLRKNPAFSCVAVVALALGIGANNTVFTFVNAARLRGLPVPNPDRIVAIRTVDASGRQGGVSYRDFEDFRHGSRTFAGIGAFARTSAHVSDEGRAPEQFQGLFVSADAFRLLGVRPTLGRDLVDGDHRPGAPPVVLIGYRLWKGRYGGDPSVVGRAIGVNGVPSIVVGVMPEGFEFDYWAELWQPLALMPAVAEQKRSARVLSAFGRLEDRASVAEAQGELDTIAERLSREYPDSNEGVRVSVRPFTGGLGTDPILLSMMGAVGFVLLIACANVANLLLARSARRSREISTRLSLGATRGRIVRQLLLESAWLAVLAGTAGFGLSVLGIRLFAAAIANVAKPYWIHWSMDGRVFAFFAAVCVGTALLFSLAPALHLSRSNMKVLKQGGRSDTGGRSARRWTSSLLIAEVALTLVLLAGAGLMVRSFLTLYRLDLAVDTSHLTTMALRLPEAKYPSAEQRTAFFERLEKRLGAIEPLSSSTIASTIPFAGASSRFLEIDARTHVAGETRPSVSYVTVGSRYFETLGLGLLQGRTFTESGNETAIVNELFVSAHFENVDPIGRRIRLIDGSSGGGRSPWLTIVGVSPTVRQRTLQEPDPVVYVPYRAEPGPYARLIVRSPSDPSDVVSLLREEVRALDPDLPLHGIMAVDELLSQSRWPYRVYGIMLALFSLIGLVLSAVGLYAVTACSVMQRTQEIGVRMALGAEARHVGWLVGRRVSAQLAVGLLLGMVGALGMGRLLSSFLIQTSPMDPLALGSMTGLLTGVCFLASFFPARRATHLDPVLALRHE